MNLTWFVIRGSGIVAYSLLAVATIWGLLVSTKVLGRAVNAKGLGWFHESAGLAALLATAVHMVALGMDEYIEFGLTELLVPGASTWRPLGVALGITGFYGVFLVSGTFYIKKRIGQNAWRAIHYLSFGSFAAAAIHGVMVGTDTQGMVGVALYLVPSIVVGVLLVVRIAQVRTPIPAGASATRRGAVRSSAAPVAERDALETPVYPTTGTVKTTAAPRS